MTTDKPPGGCNITPTSQSQGPDDTTLAFLLTHEFQQAFYAWDAAQPARDGLHASSAHEPDAEWCTRQHVLADAFPAERQTKEQYLPSLQKFLHGWQIHGKWQYKLLEPTGLVVTYREEVAADEEYEADVEIGPELDHTHIDAESGIHFSPDAIIQYAGLTLPIEIKGINHEDYAGQEELYRVTVKNNGMLDMIAYEKAQEKRPGIVGATLAEAAERNKSIRSAIPQLNLYLRLLGLTEPPNNRGIILVEDKNTQDFCMWVYTYDPELVEKPLLRAKAVAYMAEEYKQNGTLPPRRCATRNESRAKRCPFRDACFSRANGGSV